MLDFECLSQLEFNNEIGFCVFPDFEYDVIHMKFENAVDMWKRQHIDANLQLKSFIYYILCSMAKPKSKVKNGKSHTEAIVDFIADNIRSSSLSLKYLCEVFFISESQLRRDIYKYTGMNPNQYILKLRLNMALTELTNTDKSIKVISDECGFSSQYYFSKCFSKQFGLCPKLFREKFANQ